jgi:hypothetical protein
MFNVTRLLVNMTRLLVKCWSQYRVKQIPCMTYDHMYVAMCVHASPRSKKKSHAWVGRASFFFWMLAGELLNSLIRKKRIARFIWGKPGENPNNGKPHLEHHTTYKTSESGTHDTVVTQHTTACCSMQVVDITLVKYHFTNITSLRVVQRKHSGLYSST